MRAASGRRRYTARAVRAGDAVVRLQAFVYPPPKDNVRRQNRQERNNVIEQNGPKINARQQDRTCAESGDEKPEQVAGRAFDVLEEIQIHKPERH